ncbi:MAG: copper homeostasis protein [Bacteroidetes bacterium]|nr:copper homeostasis protein [Bacteroidota bacterium]
MKKLEIACFNPESAIIAQNGGADRVELCADQLTGGITPPYEIVIQTRKSLTIDIVVMIRPRGGNFVYTGAEFEQMKTDIAALKNTGINGFVFGILTADNQINKSQNTELVELAKPFSCTFHRAFDVAADIEAALEAVIECGFKTILTSGQKNSGPEGINELEKIIKLANNRIVIMPGGGVRSSNVAELKNKLNTSYFHSSAITDQSGIANLQEVKLLKEKLN